MSTENITTWKQLVEYADQQIEYPFEEFLEKHISFADSLTDVVCAAVVIAEDIGDNLDETKNMLARRMLHTYLQSSQWHPLIVKIIDAALIVAIEATVAALNMLFPAGWDNLLGWLFDSDGLFPVIADLFQDGD